MDRDKTLRNRHYISLIPACALCAGMLSSCFFTGIENTGHISLSKEDLKAEKTVSEESRLMENLKTDLPVGKWREGKPFLAASERVRLIFLSAEADPFNHTLYYSGHAASRTPSGRDAANISFRDSAGRSYIYQHEIPSGRSITPSDLPMLIDLDLVASADSLLRGRTLWPRTRVWDSPGAGFAEPVTGFQYLPVRVDSIVAGTPDFPLRAVFSAPDGSLHGSLLFSPAASSSRSFESRFTVSDPRYRFRDIEDDRWVEICHGRISVGMTKQEARLAYGNPDDIQTGHDYSRLIEHWHYSNGAFMRFEDGVLVSFRR